MSILLTADWHLTELPKDRYRFKAMDWLLSCLEERKVETIIILGDLTHNKNFHSDTLVNDLVDVISGMSRGCDVIVLKGNHDYVEADTPFFHFVRLLPNVKWINKPASMIVRGLGRCCFLPHTRDYKREWAGISKSWGDLIFAHNCFEGAIAESGKRLSGIPLSLFPKGARIFAGDIHSPQDIEAHGVNLTYVGAPYRIKFGDDFEPRILIIGAGGRVESILVPGVRKYLLEAHWVNGVYELSKA